MAAYRQHLTFSGFCGLAYGGAAMLTGLFTPTQAAIAGSLAGLAGMLPDLDSETGKPVREISSLVAAVAPFIAVRHLLDATGSIDGMILLGGMLYVAIRYAGVWLLARVSVHRGMFHSLPGLGIAACVTFLAYKSDHVQVRCLMGGGVALGYFSHLLLDEIFAVQWNGVRVKLNKAAGSALKCFGKDMNANAFAYGLLLFLGYATLAKSGVLITPKAPELLTIPSTAGDSTTPETISSTAANEYRSPPPTNFSPASPIGYPPPTRAGQTAPRRLVPPANPVDPSFGPLPIADSPLDNHRTL